MELPNSGTSNQNIPTQPLPPSPPPVPTVSEPIYSNQNGPQPGPNPTVPGSTQIPTQPGPIQSGPIPPPAPGGVNFLTGKKVVIAVVVFFLLVEAGWAGWTLTKGSVTQPTNTTVTSKPSPVAVPTTISFVASKADIRVGDKFDVSIKISSSKPTDGMDLIVLYDPKVLSVELDAGKKAVNTGSIYSDYPINIVEEEDGRITVSGITSLEGGLVPRGTFGTIRFTAKAAGTTTIALDFAKGNTKDSNVTENKSGNDILESVESLNLNILP